MVQGRCVDCSALCRQKADDGNFYCDRCWGAWTSSTEAERKSWPNQKEKEKQTKELLAAEKRVAELQLKQERYWLERERLEGCLDALMCPSVPPQMKRTVVFWGICDVKYDPSLPERERVKVLELGDGRSSRFSHHGALIKQRYEEMYSMDVTPLRKGVLVDNKKFTHDTFVDCGFAHLRPTQKAYPRAYDPNLASRIVKDLGVSSSDGVVVLKLVNRARGAGVVICPVSQLDATLQRLLKPKLGRDFEAWLAEHAPQALTEDRTSEILQEQVLHHWSNECSLFVAEDVCHSMLVPLSPEEGSSAPRDGHDEELFDGTMRVSFVLKRKQGSTDADSNKLELEWLGGYWKLPPSANRLEIHNGIGSSIEDAHARLVSSFNSEEKRTAPVADAHLREVYIALSPALVPIFELENSSIKELLFSYPNDATFRAFALARCATNMRPNLSKSNWALEQAKRQLRPRNLNDHRDIPERSVLSYIERSIGINHATVGDWTRAGQCFDEAVAKMPTNSGAHYAKGVFHQEEGRHKQAVDCYLKAIALDPDFRVPYMALSECWTSLGLYEKVVDVCKMCLHRQPDAPVATFNMGQAIYRLLHGGDHKFSKSEAAKLRAEGKAALQSAHSSRPEMWNSEMQKVEDYFLVGEPDCDLAPLQPLQTWRTYGWRP